jgi:AcrR family transcriptional regulator
VKLNVFTERVHNMKSAPKPPVKQPRHARKQATQARVLEVARLHFERHGFEAASIRAIASESDVATGTVLLHFTDKAGLLHAALYEDLEKAIARCLAAKTRGPLLERLSAVARAFYAYYAARPKLSRTLLRESLFAEEPWRERFAKQVVRVTTHVAMLVEQAKADGEVSPTTDAGLLSVAFASFYYFALIGWVQGGIDDPLPLFKKLMAQHLAEARP